MSATNTRVTFWTCPVDAHSERTSEDGKRLPTVEWRESTAYCLTTDCSLSSDPSLKQELVSEYIFLPQSAKSAEDEPLDLDPYDFAVVIKCKSADRWAVCFRNKEFTTESYTFELPAHLNERNTQWLSMARFTLDEAKRLASLLVDRTKVNGRNFHEWRIELNEQL